MEVLNHLEPSKSYTQKFVYDGEHILAILDRDNKFVAGYIYGTKVDDSMGMVTDYDQDGELDVLSFFKDRQNSMKTILNDKQEILQEVYYTAYGETQIVRRGQVKHKIANAFYYTSRELDSETGDYYYRARYYDPKVGRFLSEDPIGFKGGDYNLYRYVSNNPITLNDPYGKFPWGGIGSGVGWFCRIANCTGGGGPNLNPDEDQEVDNMYKEEKERREREKEKCGVTLSCEPLPPKVPPQCTSSGGVQ